MENLVQELSLLSRKEFLDVVIEKFENYVHDLGYDNFTSEKMPVPYVTNRGKLHVKGSFEGPYPYATESRNVEDVSTYSFFLVEDTEYTGLFTIEVKHFSAILAMFKITSRGIYLIDGDLPPVKEG